jgi:hypothetical protein
MFVGSPRLAVIVGWRTCDSHTNIYPPYTTALQLWPGSIHPIFTYILGKLDELC